MNNEIFVTPTLRTLARQHAVARAAWLKYVDADEMPPEAVEDAYIDTEDTLRDAAVERLNEVGTPAQVAQIKPIFYREQFSEYILRVAL